MRDELRRRLARLDPMPPGVPVEAATTESSRRLMEDIMNTDVTEQVTKQNRGARWLPAAVAVVVAGVVGVFALTDTASEPLVLNATGEDPTAMCIQFSVEELAKAPVAFEGVVVASQGGTVTLEVTRWYQGGDAAEVVLEAPPGMEALIGGIQFETGESYLITAYDDTVNYCGFSGRATPELRAAFEQAFGA